jgi:uncharacterized membrane protein YfcA
MEFDLTLALAAIAAFGAGLARGFIGFGAGLIIMPVLALLYGPVEAVITMTVIEVPATAYLLPTTIRHANWRSVAPLGISSLITIPIGAWVLAYVDAETMRRAIGVLVIGAGILLATGWRYSRTPTLGLTVPLGLLSGFIGGAANVGGPLVVVFLMAGRNTAIEVRAGIMAYFSFSTLFRILVYGVYGLFSWILFWRAALLALPYLAGIWIGSRAFGGISEKLFRGIVLAVVFTTGALALFR